MEVISPNIFDARVAALFSTKNLELNLGEKIKGLNLGFNTNEEQSVVSKNRELLQAGLEGLPIISANQVHGDEIYIAERSDKDKKWSLEEDTVGSADGLITNQKELFLAITLADCVGVLIYDPANQAIGAIHSGWRGTKKKIVNKSIRVMNDMYRSEPSRLKVFITPSIRSCCYEVGAEVASEFSEYSFALENVDGKYRLDLATIIVIDLLKAGVLEKNIELSPLCTCCQKDLYSYRREGSASGRMVAMIGLLE
ncbi:MAG: peptidoglycan editing factor PgeF [Campylobacterales bacterium]